MTPKTSKSKKKVALRENGVDEYELAENGTGENDDVKTDISSQRTVAGIFLAFSIFLGGMFFLRRKKQ